MSLFHRCKNNYYLSDNQLYNIFFKKLAYSDNKTTFIAIKYMMRNKDDIVKTLYVSDLDGTLLDDNSQLSPLLRHDAPALSITI